MLRKGPDDIVVRPNSLKDGSIDLVAVPGTTVAAGSSSGSLPACTRAREPALSLRVQFFGVSTLLFDDGATSVMVDGFLTRPSLRQIAFKELAPDRGVILSALQRGRVSCIDAIFVSHAHFDHVLDTAAVAQLVGPAVKVFGSPSVWHIARGQGLDESQWRTIDEAEPDSVGKFTVKAIRTPHTKPEFFKGAVDSPLGGAARVWQMRTGESYSFLITHSGPPRATFLVVAGAPPKMEEGAAAKCVDVTFLGVANMGMRDKEALKAHWERWVATPGAGLVVPVHWDDFTTPIGEPGEPLGPMPFPFDQLEVTTQRLVELGQEGRTGVKYLRPLTVYELRGRNFNRPRECPP